jgi:GTPase SAR1 family protein
MAKVYVSSTFRDLREYREKVRLALSQLGFDGVAMEYYVAEGRRPIEKCLADVAECDIYIGIFAWRYGWIPEEQNPEQLAITNLEYNKAEQEEKKCFIFILDDQVAWPLAFVDSDRSRIATLRDKASEKYGGIPFKNPDDLATQVVAALFKWAESQGLLAKAAKAHAFDMCRYFVEIAKRYQRLDLEGLTPPEKEEYLQVTLRSVFVEPGVRDDPPPLDLPREVRDRITQEGEIDPDDFPEELPLEEVRRTSDVYYRKRARRALDVLTDVQQPHLVILGDPGSGKSTLTRYIVLSLIDPTGDKRLRDAFEGYLPLLIELKSYVALRAQHREWKGFLEFLAYLGETEGFYPDRDTLDTHLKNDGRALVVFDGLDEVFNPEERQQIARQIVFFKETYPKARVVVTSRIIGYSRKILDDGGFRHFTLQELDAAQVAEFVEKWYDLALSDKPDEARRMRERILQAFDKSSSVRQLSGNPMLLTIMAIIGKHQELPRDRWKLYDHAATVLIQHWDVNKYLTEHAKGGTGVYVSTQLQPDAAIDSEDKREMLRRLAFRMQGGKGGLAGNYIHRQQLQDEFASYLKERYDMQALLAKSIAEAMLLQFRERNFILSLYGANLFGFVHRAFLEYFCATAFVNQFEKTQKLSFEGLKTEAFGKHSQDQSWHEVLRLICGMLAPEFTANIIEFLTEPAVPGLGQELRNDEKPWNLALAVQCLSEVRNPRMVAGPAESLLRRVCELFDRDMRRPPNMFSFIKHQIVPAAESIGSSWPRSEVLAEILRDRPSCRYAYIYDHNFGTFVGSVGRGSAPVHKEVLSYAEHTRHEQRVLAPFALACGWHDEAGTLPLLQSMANDDPNQTVRYAALYALSEHYAGYPDTLPMLRSHAVDGEFSFERAAALSGLAKQFNDDCSVFELIKTRALQEPDKFPRTAAIKGIGEYFRCEKDALPVLLRVVREDASPEPGDQQHADAYYCREAAVDALARYWPMEPATLDCLQQVVRTDKVDWMRALAGTWLAKLDQRA